MHVKQPQPHCAGKKKMTDWKHCSQRSSRQPTVRPWPLTPSWAAALRPPATSSPSWTCLDLRHSHKETAKPGAHPMTCYSWGIRLLICLAVNILFDKHAYLHIIYRQLSINLSEAGFLANDLLKNGSFCRFAVSECNFVITHLFFAKRCFCNSQFILPNNILSIYKNSMYISCFLSSEYLHIFREKYYFLQYSDLSWQVSYILYYLMKGFTQNSKEASPSPSNIQNFIKTCQNYAIRGGKGDRGGLSKFQEYSDLPLYLKVTCAKFHLVLNKL